MIKIFGVWYETEQVSWKLEFLSLDYVKRENRTGEIKFLFKSHIRFPTRLRSIFNLFSGYEWRAVKWNWSGSENEVEMVEWIELNGVGEWVKGNWMNEWVDHQVRGEQEGLSSSPSSFCHTTPLRMPISTCHLFKWFGLDGEVEWEQVKTRRRKRKKSKQTHLSLSLLILSDQLF